LKDNGGVTGRGVDIDQTKLYTIAFSVASLNDPPSGTDKQITIQEDSSSNFDAADFGFSDPLDAPNANALLGLFIRSLPVGGVLFNGVVAVNVNDFISTTAIPSLRFVPS